MKRKVPAFTMIDLLAAMVVSSMVMSSAYFAYNALIKNFMDYKKHTSNLSDAAALSGILSHDINLAKAVRKSTTDGITLDQNDNKTLRYHWTDVSVLRTTDVSTDTFHLTAENIKINFMGKEQTTLGGLADELKFTSTADGQQFLFSFEKKYAGDLLVESEMKSDGRY